jgi:hypothetical protein
MPLIKSLFALYISILLLVATASAQLIKGEVIDVVSKQPLENVSIGNIYTDAVVTTGSNGAFLITAAKDELLEFRKSGFNTVRVRIPRGFIPSYFKIIMEPGFKPEDDYEEALPNRYDNKADSLKSRRLYAHQLDFARLSAAGSIAHPFSALSKKNRQIWHFQEEYDLVEKDKYIDRTFNAEIITKCTGLKGDSLVRYMQKFRPSYEQLRNMNDYSFYTFIKKSVRQYRNLGIQRGAL